MNHIVKSSWKGK